MDAVSMILVKSGVEKLFCLLHMISICVCSSAECCECSRANVPDFLFRPNTLSMICQADLLCLTSSMSGFVLECLSRRRGGSGGGISMDCSLDEERRKPKECYYSAIIPIPEYSAYPFIYLIMSVGVSITTYIPDVIDARDIWWALRRGK